MSSRERSLIAGALLGICSLAAPAAAPGAVEFGSDLSPAANAVTNCDLPGSCSLFNSALRAGNVGSVTAPSGGVVTSVTLKKDVPGSGSWGPLQLHAVQMLGPTSWRRLAPFTALTPSDAAGSESFPARVPVSTGDYLALSGSENFYAVATQAGSTMETTFPNALNPDGTAGSSGAFVNFELLLRARLEPDADADGFGDETQDQCPSQQATQGQCVAENKKKRCKKKKAKGKGKGKGKAAAAAKKKKCKKRKKKKR